MPRIRQEMNFNALYNLGIHTVPPITSNLWILTSTTKSDPVGITLICPDKAPKSIKLQKSFHVLHLPPACSATSWHFHLLPHYGNYQTMINTANVTRLLSYVKIFMAPQVILTWKMPHDTPNSITDWLTRIYLHILQPSLGDCHLSNRNAWQVCSST